MNPNTLENKVETQIEQVPNNQMQTNQEPAPEIKTEANKENWKKYREEREKERKYAQEQAALVAQKQAEAEALRAALEAITNKPAFQKERNNDNHDESEESDEQKMERRVNQIIQEREAAQERVRKEKELKEFPVKLESTFKDFSKVCSTENLDYLEFHYPEVANAFKYAPEGFDKWASIYNAVKRFVPNIDSKIEQSKMEKNLSKPGSVSTPGASHGANAMPGSKLDEARKAANWQRMQKTLKGLSS